MATLIQVTKTARKLFRFILIGIAAFIVLRILFSIGTGLREHFYPTPPAKPTVLFGTLPPITFPKQEDFSGKFSFSIETISETKFPPLMKIYKFSEGKSSLLALEQTRKAVAGLGFTKGEKPINQTLYQWSDPNESGKVIQFDIASKNFNLTSSFYQNKDVLLAKTLPNKSDAQRKALDFLSRLSLLPQDLDLDKTRVAFFTIEGTSLIPTTSLSNAQIVRVDFFQKPIETTPMVYTAIDQSPINFLLGSAGDFDAKIVEVHFAYQNLDKENFSTYPIKTLDSVLENAKEGKMYIANLSDKTKRQVSLQKISLTYYADAALKEYLMPIFLLEGDGFTAYVSAIEDSWINQEHPQTGNLQKPTQ